MSEHIVENNPKKEFAFALGGVGLFLAIVLLIGISGLMRPAGEHIKAESAEAEPVSATASEPAATAEPETSAPVSTTAAADANEAATATATAEPADNATADSAQPDAAEEAATAQ